MVLLVDVPVGEDVEELLVDKVLMLELLVDVPDVDVLLVLELRVETLDVDVLLVLVDCRRCAERNFRSTRQLWS